MLPRRALKGLQNPERKNTEGGFALVTIEPAQLPPRRAHERMHLSGTVYLCIAPTCTLASRFHTRPISAATCAFLVHKHLPGLKQRLLGSTVHHDTVYTLGTGRAWICLG
jgi:hypothetical protein